MADVTVANVDSTWVNSAGVALNGGELRRADSAMFAGRGIALGVWGGIVRHGDTSLAVTVDGADVVTVQAGAVVIPGDAVAGTGCYRAALPAATAASLEARHATNGRIDLVVFRQLDTDVVPGHGAYTARVEVITGTPSATPGVPTQPSMSVVLARITVPATGGGAATVDSTWRTYAAGLGGEIPVPSLARLPASAATHQRARALDTGAVYGFNGSSWVAQAGSTGWSVKAADESVTSSTALQADNHLGFVVVAGGTYKFEALLFVDAAAAGANGDIDIGFTFPSGAMHFTGHGPNNSSITTGTSGDGEYIARLGATSGTSSIPFGVSTTAGTAIVGITIRGTFAALAPGTVQLVWAQLSSSANATRVRAGSSLKSDLVT